MQIQDVMTTNVTLTDPEASLREAARMMSDGDFGLLPIGENDRLIGTVTDRDITVRGVALGKDPNAAKVREVMSDGILYCFADQSAEEAAKMMGENQVRRLPVLDRDKRLVGIIALADLALETSEAADEALTGISE